MSLKITDLQIRLGSKLNTGYDSIVGDSTTHSAGTALYQSLDGVEIELDNATALQLSNTTTGTLYAGLYQYLGVISPGGNTVARGQAAFWTTTQTGANAFASDSYTNYAVSIDGSASIGDGLLAGVALVAGGAASGTTVALMNQWGWFQKLGIASILMQSTPTANTIGTAVVVNTAATTFDTRADATGTLTWGGAQGVKCFVGVMLEAPGTATSAAVKRASLKIANWIF